MNKFKEFIISRKSFYIFSLINILIFYTILILYHVLDEAMNYATFLSLSILLIYMTYDFYRFSRQYDDMNKLLNLEFTDLSYLPQPSNIIEEQYQTLLIKIDELQKELKNQNDMNYDDMINYFTLWVHQIKTPISALRLLIQSENYSQNELLSQVLKIEQYVEMVLHYIKIDHMSSDLHIQSYYLFDIVNEVVKKHATFFIQKKIRLDMKQTDRYILTDEKWISFVIEQILSNALKYTKTGTISIYEDNEVLYIQDTGIGIKEEDLPRVCEKGFTGYNGRLDKKASGLGLYLCKRIIDNLGYSLNIESIIGEGTIVSIHFHKDNLKVE